MFYSHSQGAEKTANLTLHPDNCSLHPIYLPIKVFDPPPGQILEFF